MDKLYNIHEVAKILGIGESTARRLLKRYGIEIKIGNQIVRVKERDLEALIEPKDR